ncbi:ArsR/SmtB family transcription factor [Henriciella litoralis]|uniref:ArsR/SmtB family transcription factor n=1 Tax=Henriciella litoralis TaxID=568102 RepID=UPI0009FBAB29|nr:metalloregulator ArsR/SmtB family transcription factor [Henriciella litoralis]
MGNATRKIHTAEVFGALGDETRLKLVSTLSDGQGRSISDLASGFGMSRQAVTKHLKVLESAGLVSNDRVGRESRYRLDPRALGDAQHYLDAISRHWDEAIERLKAFLGEDQAP